MNKYQISHHAQQKMAERHISPTDVNFALEKGVKIHRTGVIFFFLGKKDLPDGKQFDRLNGLTVIAQNRIIITVYRNPKVLHEIKRKAKRNNWKRFQGFGQPDFHFCRYHPHFNFCDCHLNVGLTV